MIFEQIRCGPMENFCYLIGDSDSKEAAVVDPAFEEQKLYDAAEKNGLKITKILLTHTHPDHTEAVLRVAEQTDSIIIK